MVSPIPDHNKLPRPIDDLTVPALRLPASVIPMCRGQLSMSAN